MITKQREANICLIQLVAKQLNNLIDQVVFLGGATIGLLLTDPATPDVRETKDVDMIFEVINRGSYYSFTDQLRNLGFEESSELEVICRWKIGNIIVDIMPTDEHILGFGNIWYKEAAQNAMDFKISDNDTIKLITAPYFLATKLEAFKGRGKNDFYASHDLEDIITLFDGRAEIVQEINYSFSDKLKTYLRHELSLLLKNSDFLEGVPGHLGAYTGNIQYERKDIVLERIRNIQ